MSDDLIRRQDAIDAVKGRFSMPVDNLIVEVIGALPSAQPTIDAVPIGYILQRADALIETNVYGAKVLYGLVMNWKGEEQNDEE